VNGTTDRGLAGLHPAYFALVMATGIVSIATYLVGLPVIPQVLFGLNLVFYPALWALSVARIVRHRAAFVADLSHHGRAVGFFTVVAGTCVLGSQFIVVAGMPGPAFWLWVFGILLYAVLVYSVFTALMVKEQKPPLAEGINGGWLVAVVAAQSVDVLGAQLAATMEAPERVLFFCLAMWLGGGMLYFWIISLIFYRYTFFTLAPSDLAPPYRPLPRPRPNVAVRARPHPHVVGDRHMVDPDARRPQRLAPHRPEIPPPLRSPLLGRRLPPGHVHRVHLTTLARRRGAVPVRDSEVVHLHRRHRLGPRLHRDGQARRARRLRPSLAPIEYGHEIRPPGDEQERRGYERDTCGREEEAVVAVHLDAELRQVRDQRPEKDRERQARTECARARPEEEDAGSGLGNTRRVAAQGLSAHCGEHVNRRLGPNEFQERRRDQNRHDPIRRQAV
jgi:hypothetical protein